jgi:hypothetical protein
MTGANGHRDGDDFTFADIFGPRRGELPARDGHTGELPAITIYADDTPAPYQALTEDTLSTEWENAHPPPVSGKHHHDGTPPAGWDRQVLMVVGIIGDGIQRGRPDTEIIGRGAITLRHDPYAAPGTPLLGECGHVYMVGDGPPDWRTSGATSGMCYDCTLAAPKHAAKPPPPAKAPAAAKPAARRRRPSQARKTVTRPDTP